MRSLVMIGACLLLAACSGAQDEPAESAGDTEERETVFDPMTDSLDRAKDVEELGKDRKKAMDEALQDAEGRAPE